MADWPGDDLDQLEQHTKFVAEHYRKPSAEPILETVDDGAHLLPITVQ